MISVLFLILAIWLGLVLDEEFEVGGGDFLMRLAAAIVLGLFVAGWITFGAALFFGFNPGTVVAVMAVVLLANLFAWQKRRRNWAWFRSLLFLDRPFWVASGFFVSVVVFFFAFGVWTDPDGAILFRGNFTDLAFHMGTVASFIEQTHFPPFNPQSANAKLSYHFMADFVGAILAQGGFSFYYSLKVLMVLLAFSLGTTTCRFFHVLLGERVAMVAATLLFFFGHIGVFHLAFGLLGFPVGNVPLTLTSWHSIEDHLTFPYFNFLNVIVNFFQPQTPFLFCFPLALLIVLGSVRRFTAATPINRGSIFLSVLVALLPLFHVHSFLVLAPVVALLIGLPWLRQIFIESVPVPAETRGTKPTSFAGLSTIGLKIPAASPPSPRRLRLVVGLAGTFALATILVGLQFAFILSQPKAPGYSGFDVAERLSDLRDLPHFLNTQRLWFWVRTAGMPFVLGLFAFALPSNLRLRSPGPDRRAQLALFTLFGVTSAWFIVINFYRFTPNWGDNNKFFLYWNLLLCLFAGRLLGRLWRGSWWWRAGVATLLLMGGVLPSGVEIIFRFLREPATLFTAGSRITADWIRLNTPRDSVFLTSNSYTHYVPPLGGRRVVNGSYTKETGFADQAIEDTVARVYRTGDVSPLSNRDVGYLVVGPEERSAYWVNTANLARFHRLVFEQTTRGAKYSVFAVRPLSPQALECRQAEDESRGFIELSRLEPKSISQFGTLRIDESFTEMPLRLNGTAYGTGLGTHAPSVIEYDLNGEYARFEAMIGLDDSQRGGVGSIVFHVEIDGRDVFTSSRRTAGEAPLPLKIDLAGAKTLTLRVDDAGDGNHCDHADWADAKLIRRK